MAGGVNLYAYSGNNPIRYRDPFGLSPCPEPPCRTDKDGMEGRPLPPDVDPDKVTWVENPDYGSQGGYYEHDETGAKYIPDPSRKRHWPHWDIVEPGGKTSHYPKQYKQPWPGQKKLGDDQSATDPWPSLWDRFVEALGQVLQGIAREVVKWPSPIPPLPGRTPTSVPALPGFSPMPVPPLVAP